MPDITKPLLATEKQPGIITGSILVVGGQNLIVWPQLERTSDDIDAKSGIGYKNYVVSVGIDVTANCLPGGCQIFSDVCAQKLHRLPFQAALPLLVNFKNRARRRPK